MYDETAIYTGNTVMNTTETMENETTEILVENEDTVEDMDFDELTIHSDASAYDILEEEHETISLNDIVTFRVITEIWKGRVMQIPFSDGKEDSECLKTKWIDQRKEDKVIRNNFSLDYS